LEKAALTLGLPLRNTLMIFRNQLMNSPYYVLKVFCCAILGPHWLCCFVACFFAFRTWLRGASDTISDPALFAGSWHDFQSCKSDTQGFGLFLT
jgi:hypothetical protein